MGSSGGSSSFNRPSTPVPPNVADYGSTTGFQPTYVNFLGDTNVPSTGLTPDMLKQIDSGAYMKPGNPIPGADSGGGDRGLLAQIMARLDAMQQPQQRNPFNRLRSMGSSNGGRGGGGGYTTSGRSGAGSFGSRSSSASRAGGGLY